MSWEDILKIYDLNDMKSELEQLKDYLNYAMKTHTPERVKNEEGKFILENVEEALDDFKEVETHMRELKQMIADYLKTIGLWDGSYGYAINPQDHLFEEGEER